MKNDRNLISINCQTTVDIEIAQPRRRSLLIVYSRQALIELRNKVQCKNNGHTIDPWTCALIRRLRLNNRYKTTRRKRGSRGGSHVKNKSNFFLCINPNNLCKVNIQINRTIPKTTELIKITTINVQSIKNKDHLVRTHIDDLKTDIVVLSETWLNEGDDHWINQSELNNEGWMFYSAPRTDRKGGGLAICTKVKKVKEIRKGQTRTFEFAIWQLITNNVTTYIIGIYRPPYSAKHPATLPQFLDDFTEFLAIVLASMTNIIICGDFNIQYDDTNNPDVNIYADTCEALGLTQHTELPTHKAGHILDHILTEAQSTIKVQNCETGAFISDHCSVSITLEAEKDNMRRKTITNRNYKKLDANALNEMLVFDCNTEDLQSLVSDFNSVVKQSLDVLVPEKTRTITIRQNKDWFTDELREWRSRVRRRERIYRHYREDHQWTALKKVRNSYNFKLKGDTKKLYQTFNKLTGVVKLNPLRLTRNRRMNSQTFS
ncbi:hypothetical protein SNE40_001781 [Patella caerulea]|uniref:Endonuclease/exonuclease/phosphatase domain-containing protein n=1 Tax=Patella caerulea TaxID=87958 RepID=A0AAN8JZU9_PATCE